MGLTEGGCVQSAQDTPVVARLTVEPASQSPSPHLACHPTSVGSRGATQLMRPRFQRTLQLPPSPGLKLVAQEKRQTHNQTNSPPLLLSTSKCYLSTQTDLLRNFEVL